MYDVWFTYLYIYLIYFIVLGFTSTFGSISHFRHEKTIRLKPWAVSGKRFTFGAWEGEHFQPKKTSQKSTWRFCLGTS